MRRSIDQRLAAIRGSLPAEEPGARGLERVARNPACQRQRALTMVGIRPTTAMDQVYGQPAAEGQSPFAISIGNRFEKELFDVSAAKLLDLYVQAGLLSAQERKVVVIPAVAPGASPAAMARRRAETLRLLQRKLTGDPTAPNIIIQGRLPIPLLSIEHDTEPDALVAADAEPFYRPVEIKSYPDRAGKTDPADVRGACRQAAVAVLGLRHALAKLGHPNPVQVAPPLGDLVLRRPGSLTPTLSPMTLLGEVHSLERALNEAPRSLADLEAMLAGISPGAALDDPAVLDAIPCHYRSSCREHCALAARCKQQAIAQGDPVLLGDAAREELAAAGSIQRTLVLIQGGQPATVEEAALAQRLSTALAEYRRAV